MTVLKGANAAALYGSRAANGVILITTKSGRDKNKVKVEVSSTTTFENVARLPKYQNKWSQGANGVLNIGTATTATAHKTSKTCRGDARWTDRSWHNLTRRQ